MADTLTETKAESSRSNVSNEVKAQFMREVAAAQRTIDEATGVKRALLKRAKTAGCNLDSIAFVHKAKKRDPDEVVAQLRSDIEYAQIARIPISKSGLFDDLEVTPLDAEAQAAESGWAAEEAGYESGKANGSRDDNPFKPGDATHGQWDAGFKRGKKYLADNTDEASKPASTRARKNRPADLH